MRTAMSEGYGLRDAQEHCMPASATTRLTPNSACAVRAAFISNNLTTLRFNISGAAYWNVDVSARTPTATLSTDIGNNLVTFKKGTTITYIEQDSGNYMLILSGKILDGGSIYSIVGLSLGLFLPEDRLLIA